MPYAPDTVDGLVGATAENTNGTDIAVDANGGKHVVWAGRDGIWYATGTDVVHRERDGDRGMDPAARPRRSARTPLGHRR